MSLKTRCPACDTVFKIVPDQLKVSSGWVRCGRCAEVFDAAAHAADADANNAFIDNTTKNIAIQAINTPSTAILASNLIKNEQRHVVLATDQKVEVAPVKNDIKSTSEAELSFVRIAESKAFWQRASVVRSLRAACIALIGLLFFQVVYSQRHHLAASNPVFKTGFEALCQDIGCVIEPFKNIDAFKIDSSSFQKAPAAASDALQTEKFTLKLALKNNAEIAIAVPAVELTLTDTNDKAVLRRVLLAKELGFNTGTMAANGEWSGSMTLAVMPNASSAAIMGYRILLFYP